MCTILTIGHGFFNRAMRDHIRDDFSYNRDGTSMLLVNETGATTFIRSMDIDTILLVLQNTDWERIFLHQRAATQGVPAIENSHGWNVKGVYYFHNGILSNPAAKDFDVDSQLIGQWLTEKGIDGALSELQTERFANVFLVDTDNAEFHVYRGILGTLYTDGKGNYSTNPIDPICKPVEQKTAAAWHVPEMTKPTANSRYDDYSEFYSDYYDKYRIDNADNNYGIGDYIPKKIRA